MKAQIKEFLLRVLPVMIGVYLGFVLSNWNEGQKRKHQVEVLKESILQEIEFNTEALKRKVEYHAYLKDSVEYYLEMADSLEAKKPNFFQGLQITPLVSSAYQTGNQTGIITELKMNTILKLNQLYTYQNDYNDYVKITMAGFINKDFTDKRENVYQILHFLSITMTDLEIKERDLIKNYDNIKQNLN